MLTSALLSQKYKPKTFDEFEIAMDPNNSKFFDTLRLFIRLSVTASTATTTGVVPVNFLLVGKSSSGKTSLLEAFVTEYAALGAAPDVMIITNLIEQITNYLRNDLKTFCQTSATVRGKKKIVVLDDFDLMHEQNQHIFRNLLDKYSHNVIFIGSCKNLQHITESIQSRMFLLHIPQLSEQNVTSYIRKIEHEENIHFAAESPAICSYIYELSRGNMGVIIHMYEKLKILMHIDSQAAPACNVDILQLVSDINPRIFKQFNILVSSASGECANEKIRKAIDILQEIYDDGYSILDMLDNYYAYLKLPGTDELTEDQKYAIIPIICTYISNFYNIHEDEIELALFTNDIANRLAT